MPTRFEELRRLCTSQAEQLGVFVQALSPEQWNVQSACAAWQIGDVVAHLAASAHLFGELIPAMAGDKVPTTEWRTPNPDRQETVADDARELRRRLGDDGLRRYFAEGSARFIQGLRGLRPEDADKTSPAAMGGRRTIYQIMGARVGEMVVHRWDMESRLRPDARLAPEALPVLMGNLAGWRTFSFRKGPPGPAVHYRWEIAGTPPVHWDLVVRGDSFEHVRAPAHAPDVLFRTDAETYVLAGMGRVDFAGAVAGERIRAQGRPEAIRAYPGYFPNL